jgi:hypothetical protein
MGKDTGKGYRQGEEKGRTQFYSSQLGKWVKRDTATGRFDYVKQTPGPYKGVRKER